MILTIHWGLVKLHCPYDPHAFYKFNQNSHLLFLHIYLGFFSNSFLPNLLKPSVSGMGSILKVEFDSKNKGQQLIGI
jgi:hypothetical protein